jgi:hypothetical protein
MSGIDVRIDTSELQGLVKQLEGLNARGIKFATQRAVNNAAFKVRDDWKSKAEQVFDRPTTFTRNAVLVQRAGTFKSTKGFVGTGNDQVARVFLRDEAKGGVSPQVYLQQQAIGGSRSDKRFERALRAQGLLPRGMQTFPTTESPLDAFGNFEGGYKKKIMAQLRVFRDQLQNESDESRDRKERRAERKGVRLARLFVLQTKKGRMPAGIYERVGFNFGGQNVSAVRMIIAYGRIASYRPRFPIFDYARAVWQRESVPEFRAALTAEIDRALAKAARAAGNGAS